MATMKEIARLAGVSRGTVDRVINRRGSVNIETEKKILDIVARLNYRPNQAGIALAAQKKNLSIGVVLFGRDNPFFDDVIVGLHKKSEDLQVYGIQLFVKRISFHLEDQLAAIDELVDKGINGLLLSPHDDERVRKRINDLWKKGIVCVTTNTDLPDSKRIAFVGSDFYKCGQTAASLLHLMSFQPAKVAIITGSRHILCHSQRVEGFCDAIAAMTPSIEVVDIIEAHDDDIESYEATDRLLKKHNRLDAIYFTASGMYGCCRRLLLSDEKSPRPKVIGFDAVPTTIDMMKKGIITATITQEPQLQGSLSLSILQDYLVYGTIPQEPIYHTDLSIKLKENL